MPSLQHRGEEDLEPVMMMVVQGNIIPQLVEIADLMRIIYHVDYPSGLWNNNGTH